MNFPLNIANIGKMCIAKNLLYKNDVKKLLHSFEGIGGNLVIYFMNVPKSYESQTKLHQKHSETTQFPLDPQG